MTGRYAELVERLAADGLVGQERLHGEELAGIDLGQEGGEAEARLIEPEGGLPCPGRAL